MTQDRPETTHFGFQTVPEREKAGLERVIATIRENVA